MYIMYVLHHLVAADAHSDLSDVPENNVVGCCVT